MRRKTRGYHRNKMLPNRSIKICSICASWNIGAYQTVAHKYCCIVHAKNRALWTHSTMSMKFSFLTKFLKKYLRAFNTQVNSLKQRYAHSTIIKTKQYWTKWRRVRVTVHITFSFLTWFRLMKNITTRVHQKLYRCKLRGCIISSFFHP